MMRRWICAVVCLGLAFVVCRSYAQERDESQRRTIKVPFTNSPPTIDGVLSAGEWDDAAYDNVLLPDKGFYGDGSDLWDGPEDHSYGFWVKYDDTNVYFGVSVKDDIYISENYGETQRWNIYPVWENDAVEYFFDGDQSRSESRNDPQTGGQFIIGLGTEPANSVRVDISEDLLPPEDYQWKTIVDKNTADWTQEAKFPLYAIGAPKPGDWIGFNMSVDDPDSHDPLTRDPEFTDYLELRDTQIYWEGFPNSYGGKIVGTENRESMWGTMIFLEKGAPVRSWELY